MLKFFDQEDLLDRLAHACQAKTKNIVFIVGSPLTAPYGDAPGVASVDGVISYIRNEFANDKNALAKLDGLLASQEQHEYQSAFEFLIGRRGQSEANRLIRCAECANFAACR
jgi:hypothetical protein